MTCFPPCLLSFLSHHNHHHHILKNRKKLRHFFKKNFGKKKKRQISVLIAHYQKSWRDGPRFWMQIPAAEVARGLRECISAYTSAMFGDCLFFFHICLAIFCMELFRYGPCFRRFPFFVFGILNGLFHKIVFLFFDEKCALRTCGVFMVLCDFRTQNYVFPLFCLWRSLEAFIKTRFFVFLMKKVFW